MTAKKLDQLAAELDAPKEKKTRRHRPPVIPKDLPRNSKWYPEAGWLEPHSFLMKNAHWKALQAEKRETGRSASEIIRSMVRNRYGLEE